MLILSVTAFRDHQKLAIGFDKFYGITNLHVQILAYIAFLTMHAPVGSSNFLSVDEWKK